MINIVIRQIKLITQGSVNIVRWKFLNGTIIFLDDKTFFKETDGDNYITINVTNF